MIYIMITFRVDALFKIDFRNMYQENFNESMRRVCNSERIDFDSLF